jgi:PHD/YefM family antitoxin component YafN of YafNO toxin-antitoxin module
MNTLTREVTARQFRAELATLSNEAAFARGRIGLHRYGALVAVLIGVEDFQRLRRLESAPGALEAEESLDELAQRLIAEGQAVRRALEGG